MDPNQYQQEARRTQCNMARASVRMDQAGMELNPDNLAARTLPVWLNHAVLGLSGEVGELSALVEHWLYYGKDLDRDKFKEELGDCLWYVAEACNALGLSMADVMAANIRKLQTRYPDKFTEQAATDRNLEAEAAAVSETPGAPVRPFLGHRFDDNLVCQDCGHPHNPNDLDTEPAECLVRVKNERNVLSEPFTDDVGRGTMAGPVPRRRTRSDVLRMRKTVGCCGKFLDRQPCDCLESAPDDVTPAPGCGGYRPGRWDDPTTPPTDRSGS